MIKNIIFDLGEVLLAGIRDTGLGLAIKHDLEMGERKSPLKVSIREEFFHGNVTENEYIDAVLNEYPILGKREELKKHIRNNFIEIEGTRAIIMKFKKLGYKLALLSTHAREWIEYCNQKFNHHELFDIISYSYEDKVSKPDRRSFNLVLERLNAKPEECLFIDDRIENIEAAERLGINAIQFSNAIELEEKIKNLLPDYK